MLTIDKMEMVLTVPGEPGSEQQPHGFIIAPDTMPRIPVKRPKTRPAMLAVKAQIMPTIKLMTPKIKRVA